MRVSFLSETARIFSYDAINDYRIYRWLDNLPYMGEKNRTSKNAEDDIWSNLYNMSCLKNMYIGMKLNYSPKYIFLDEKGGVSSLAIFGILLLPVARPTPLYGHAIGCAVAYTFHHGQLSFGAESQGDIGSMMRDLSDRDVAFLMRDVKSITRKAASCGTSDALNRVIHDFHWSKPKN